MHLERYTTYEYLLCQSVSQWPIKLNAVIDGVFERECFGEIVFHLKRILKSLYYQVKA